MNQSDFKKQKFNWSLTPITLTPITPVKKDQSMLVAKQKGGA